MPLRLLLLADTHLGFDLPVRPQVRRRRRGEDFLANFRRALEPALAGDVDLVVHGGDVFHRPRVPPSLVYQAFEPLREVAERGVPVFVVPGNHERGRIPHAHLGTHPNIHVFDRPRSFLLRIRGYRVRLLGFPYRRRIREAFPGLIRELTSAWEGEPAAGREEAAITLLCVHHCFEGSRVEGHTFRDAPDVVRGADIPGGIAAVLTGHVHRHQVLERDLAGMPLAAPVFHPGSVERTAFAERNETKGYLRLVLDAGEEGGGGGRVREWRFQKLPARPMILRELRADDWDAVGLDRAIDEAIAASPPDAVLRLRISGTLPEGAHHLLRAGRLRRRTPPTMNLSVVFPGEGGRRHERGSRRLSGSRRYSGSIRGRGEGPPPEEQLALALG